MSSTFERFLTAHQCKKGGTHPITHTSMGGSRMGSYSIGADEMDEFYSLYKQSVLMSRLPCHLTEVQYRGEEEGQGPMLVDLDFHYSLDVTERQHTSENLDELIRYYSAALCDLFEFKSGDKFNVYVMEKRDVNRLSSKNMTKDGIHLLFGLKVSHELQGIVRQKVIHQFEEESSWTLPLTNSLNDVFDNSITKGSTNWMLYGSRKPECDAYELTRYYTLTFDESREEFNYIRHGSSTFDVVRDFACLTARYRGNPSFELKEHVAAELQQRSPSAIVTRAIGTALASNGPWDSEVHNIYSVEQLKEEATRVLEMMRRNTRHSEIIEQVHHATIVLSSRFYEPGSHTENRKVAFALRRLDNRFFYSWMWLRSRASDFNILEIGERYTEWMTTITTAAKTREQNGTVDSAASYRSIIFHAKHEEESKDQYLQWYQSSISRKLDRTLEEDASDFSIAIAVYAYFSEQIICGDCTHNRWYTFEDHHLVKDGGDRLRVGISQLFATMYDPKLEMARQALQVAKDQNAEKPVIEELKARVTKLVTMKRYLDSNSGKNKIINECQAVFFDPEFLPNENENPNLMAFQNGVVDFSNQVFRNGTVQDYITKSTGIRYIPYASLSPAEKAIEAKIENFMNTVFPDKETCLYMWEHLAAALIGRKIEHTLSVYNGSGSNGKSVFVKLVTKGFGTYKGEMPVSYITDKRTGIGKATPEIALIRGCRYVVMNEPSKNQSINEGPMKEITGEDMVTGRMLFSDPISFTPQASFVVLTNYKLRINASDDGTWRRIKDIPFDSKFYFEADIPIDNSSSSSSSSSTTNANKKRTIEDGSTSKKKTRPLFPQNQHVFPADPTITSQLDEWAPVFMSRLVDIAFKRRGHITPSRQITAASNAYRYSQDLAKRFIDECIVETDDTTKRLSKNSVSSAYTEWLRNNGDESGVHPSKDEVYTRLTEMYPNKDRVGWKNLTIGDGL